MNKYDIEELHFLDKLPNPKEATERTNKVKETKAEELEQQREKEFKEGYTKLLEYTLNKVDGDIKEGRGTCIFSDTDIINNLGIPLIMAVDLLREVGRLVATKGYVVILSHVHEKQFHDFMSTRRHVLYIRLTSYEVEEESTGFSEEHFEGSSKL